LGLTVYGRFPSRFRFRFRFAGAPGVRGSTSGVVWGRVIVGAPRSDKAYEKNIADGNDQVYHKLSKLGKSHVFGIFPGL
jgi:hypothetical protein